MDDESGKKSSRNRKKNKGLEDLNGSVNSNTNLSSSYEKNFNKMIKN